MRRRCACACSSTAAHDPSCTARKEPELSETSTPQRLLKRLDDLGAVLARRGDAMALIGLGSVGADLDRLDDYSDLDFFVVVDDDAKQGYLDSIDWLEEPCAVSFSFRNTVDGRKALFTDRLFAEYAVFTLDELRRNSYTAGRVVWQRGDAPPGLETPQRPPGTGPSTVDWQVNEALTNLYVGLQREARGERLGAMRLIQAHAVDRVVTLAGLLATEEEAGARDPFAVERRAEARFGPDVLPLARMAPGYGHSREAALAVLEWLERRVEVDRALTAAVRELAA